MQRPQVAPQSHDFTLRCHVPQFGCAFFPCGGHGAAIGSEGDPGHASPMREEVGFHQSQFSIPKRHAAVTKADGHVASWREVAPSHLPARKFKFTNDLARLEVPDLDVPAGVPPPGRKQEVGPSEGFHSVDIYLPACVELAERIAFEIPNADFAVSSTRQQLAAIRRKVALGPPKAAQL